MPEKTKKKRYRKKTQKELNCIQNGMNKRDGKKYKSDLKRYRKEGRLAVDVTASRAFRDNRFEKKNKFKLIRDLAAGIPLPHKHRYFTHSDIIPEKSSDEWKTSFMEIIDFIDEKNLDWLDDTALARAVARLADYSFFWIRRPRDFKVKFYNSQKQFFAFVRHLFSEYPVPEFMDNIWLTDYNDKYHYDWFIDIGSGKNIRKCYGLPVKLTKKMAHHFLFAPKDFTMIQAFKWGQIFGLGGNARVAKAVANTRMGRTECGRERNEFWESVLRFFINNPFLDPNQYGPIVDYVNNQKYETQIVMEEGQIVNRVPQPGFSMHKRNPEILLRHVQRWHDELNSTKRIQGGKSWDHCDVGDFTFEEGVPGKRNHKVWNIVQLLSSKQLEAEGRIMNHCVGSYTASCSAYRTTIWSLMLSDCTQIMKSMATIEMNATSKHIHETRGKSNRSISNRELNIINRWASNEQLTISSWLTR